MLYVIEIGRKTRSGSFMCEAVRYIDSEETYMDIKSCFKTQYKGFDVNVRVVEQDLIEHFVPPEQSEPQKE